LELTFHPLLVPAHNKVHFCVSPEAQAWKKLTSHLGPTAPRWREGWSGASMKYEQADARMLITFWRTVRGDWSAAQWTWRPSTRPATRDWQARQWARIEAAASQEHRELNRQASPLMTTWLAVTANVPSAIDKDRWVWQVGDTCLRMRIEDISQAQLALPYSRDDTRLEQRAAMQVQLARAIPGATWVRPFTLIATGPDGARGGAKYMAIWLDPLHMHGQVWMPQKNSGDIVRARISTTLPAGSRTDTVRTEAMMRLFEDQLVRFAHMWEATHE
jgi:hypothetical protein